MAKILIPQLIDTFFFPKENIQSLNPFTTNYRIIKKKKKKKDIVCKLHLIGVKRGSMEEEMMKMRFSHVWLERKRERKMVRWGDFPLGLVSFFFSKYARKYLKKWP